MEDLAVESREGDSSDSWSIDDAEMTAELEHVPLMLKWEREGRGMILDERGFELHGPLAIQELTAEQVSKAMDRGHEGVVADLAMVLGRTPSKLEVYRELIRSDIFTQIRFDESNPIFRAAETDPQAKLMEKRKGDFPAPEGALDAFANGKARLQCDLKSRMEHLILTVQNAEGREVDHHVMTTAEIDWVKKSAQVVARAAGGKGKVFIAGLGQAILNKELQRLGVPLRNQVVAELNHGVIELVGRSLNEENPEDQLNLRQGDFMTVLDQAVKNEERFSAIMIDAFPNKGDGDDGVNRDGSNYAALNLAYEALEPGGVLTCYPDSRYLPARILTILTSMGIPESAIHYTVAEFKEDPEFIDQYSTTRIMGVLSIRKPLEADESKINAMKEAYYNAVPDNNEGLDLALSVPRARARRATSLGGSPSVRRRRSIKA
ncbi:hypothetical protein KA119_02065 [Candidatus Gracilibacteria bacterium]|nr:hypothetical protein [Candidatus Gracilibacteria bacterium]